MALSYFGKKADLERLCKDLNPHWKKGISNQALLKTIRNENLTVEARKNFSFDEIKRDLSQNSLVIINYIENKYDEGHYALVSKVGRKYIHLLDPLHGKNFKLLHAEFKKRWQSEFGGHKRWAAVVSEAD